MGYLPIYLPTNLLIYLPTYLPTYLLTYAPTYLYTKLTTYLPILTYLLTDLPVSARKMPLNGNNILFIYGNRLLYSFCWL